MSKTIYANRSQLKLITYALSALLGGYLYFNRNPKRKIPQGENLVSPADGTIQIIQGNRIEIFIGITDVHYQRTPYYGVISYIEDVDATYNIIEMDSPLGHIVIERYAGKLARTVKTFLKIEDDVEKGQVLGKIILGSHCTIIIPPGMNIIVKEGQHLRAGETIVAVSWQIDCNYKMRRR